MEDPMLEILEGGGRSRNVPLARLPFTIGRGSENHLVLTNVSVSRHHATIQREAEGLAILDNGSRNGVWVNGERIRNRQSLRGGDVIRIGGTSLRLSSEPAAVPLAPEETGTLEFFPNPTTQDLLGKLSSASPGLASGLPGTQLFANWEQALRLLTEAPLPELFDKVLAAIEDATAYERCFVFLFRDESPDRLKVLARRVRQGPGAHAVPGSAEVLVSRAVLRRVAESREAVMVKRGDAEFIPTDSFILSGAGAALCFPLVARDRVIGVLYLDRMLGAPAFSWKDVETLGPLVGLVGLKVENLELLEAYLDAQIHKRDLDIAEAVQRDFFAGRLPRLPGYVLDGYTQPCRQVGGDFFDVVACGTEELAITMGDVSGKGLPSALYMVGVLSTLRAHLEDGIDIESILKRLERYTHANFHADHFLTLFLGKVNARTGLLRYCNAGHMPPIVVSETGDVRELEGADPALNLTAWGEFRRFEHRLVPGDLLLVYTDGLVEEEAEGGEQFGKDRLLECLREHRDQELSLLRETILSALRAFSGSSGPEDDKSLLLLRRLPESSGAPIGGDTGEDP